MKITIHMIMHQLEKKYKNVRTGGTFEKDTSQFSFPMRLTNQNISTDHLFIASAKEVEDYYAALSECHIICLHKPHIPKKCRLSILMIEDDVNLTDILNDVIQIFQLYDDWEKQIYRIAYSNQNLSQIFQSSEYILENPCVMIDTNYTYMVYTKNFFQNQFMNEGEAKTNVPLSFVNDFQLDEDFKKLTKKKGLFYYDGFHGQKHMLCINITYRKHYFARIIMRSDHHEISGVDEEHLSILARCIQLIFDTKAEIIMDVSQADTLRALLHTLIEEQQTIPYMDIERILKQSDWKRTDTFLAIHLSSLIANGIDTNRSYLCIKIEQLWRGSLAIQIDDSIIWILNLNLYQDSSDYAFYQSLAYFLRETLYRAGISNACNDLTHISMYAQQARMALELGNQKNPMYWYHHFRDYTMEYIMANCTKDFPAKELIHPALITLIQYDQEENSDLYLSLKTYLECRFNITDAAKILYVHRTTLINRLNRIKQLTGVDLENSTVIQNLMISFSLNDWDQR